MLLKYADDARLYVPLDAWTWCRVTALLEATHIRLFDNSRHRLNIAKRARANPSKTWPTAF